MVVAVAFIKETDLQDGFGFEELKYDTQEIDGWYTTYIYILIIHMMACIKETDHCDDSWFKELLIRPQNDDE